MAIIANTFLTFDAKGLREQLSDTIFNVTPEETMFTSMISKERVKGTLFEWQVDSFASPDPDNAKVQGDDVTTFAAVTPTTRVGNVTQISRREFVISDTEEEVEKAGRASEVAYQTVKKGVELRRDIEAAMLQYTGGGVTGDSTTAPRAAGLLAWVKTNDLFGSGGASPVYTSGVPGAGRSDGTQRNLDETIHKAVLQAMWNTSGPVDGIKVLLGPVNKQKASAFAGIATKNFDISRAEPSAIIASADVYVSDFGTVVMLPSRHQRERDAWYINPSYVSWVALRPYKRVPLAKTGDGTKVMLIVEWSLKVKNEAALGMAADLSTT